MSGVSYEQPDRKNSGKFNSLTMEKVTEKLESLKKWTMSTALVTKQYLGEKFGNRPLVTSDPTLEAQVAFLYSSYDRHNNLLRQFSDLLGAFTMSASCQYSTASSLNEILDAEGGEDPDMKEALSECKRALSNAGGNTEMMCQIITHVVEQLQTLCQQVMSDSMKTAKSLKTARLAYDSSINDYEKSKTKMLPGSPQAAQIEESIRTQKREYDATREKLVIKLKFLDANKVSVMRHQLSLFRRALVAFYQGNATIIADVLKSLAPSAAKFSS